LDDYKTHTLSKVLANVTFIRETGVFRIRLTTPSVGLKVNLTENPVTGVQDCEHESATWY